MTTNAERQAAYKERMRKAGYQQITLWIQPQKKHCLMQFVEQLSKYQPDSKESTIILEQHPYGGDMWISEYLDNES